MTAVMLEAMMILRLNAMHASTHRIVNSLEPISECDEPHQLSKQVPTADEAGAHAEAAWTAIRGACVLHTNVGMNVQSLQT